MTNETPSPAIPDGERLFSDDSPILKLSAMLQGLEFEPGAVNLSAAALRAACRAIAKQAKRAASPARESVRVTEEMVADAEGAYDQFVIDRQPTYGICSRPAMRAALEAALRVEPAAQPGDAAPPALARPLDR